MLAAIVLFPILILGDQWHSAQIVDLRDHPTRLVGSGRRGRSRPPASSPRSSAAGRSSCRWRSSPPFPSASHSHAGGDTANLLVPLYLVIAGGVLAAASETGHRRRAREPRCRAAPAPGPAQGRPPRLAAAILAAVVVLYALQALYSPDFSKGLQNVCFFLVPFTVAYALLRDVEWDRKLLTCVLVGDRGRGRRLRRWSGRSST